MKTRLLFLLVPLAVVAVLAAGCGGGSPSVPADGVATVGSTPITKTDFNGVMTYAFARYKSQGQPQPKVGTTAYTQLRDQAVGFLVTNEEFRQEGQKMGVTVTQKEVDARLAQIKKSYGAKKFVAALKRADITATQYANYSIAPTLLGEKLQAKVTSGIKVSKDDAKKYYDQNKGTFTSPKTREVRHILVNSRSLAERLETRLKNGASFAQLAEKYSKDTSSAKQGGKLCVAHGTNSGACIATVPAFDKVAFSLKTHAISPPVHSPYGWHIIQALTPITPAHTQSFSEVESQIELNLGQQKKQAAWAAWLAKVKKDYQGKVAYQTGYAPATTTTPTVSTPTTTG
jgi:foldase protein PrsA